jgi:hypothetical protein
LFFMAGMHYGGILQMDNSNQYVEWACGKYAEYQRPNLSVALNMSYDYTTDKLGEEHSG